MTRRIALAILLTVWVMLVAGGAGAYVLVRHVMLADLDKTLEARALGALAMKYGPREQEALSTLEPDDRFRVEDDELHAMHPAASTIEKSEVLERKTVDVSGEAHRVVRLKATIRVDGAPRTFTANYSRSMRPLNGLLTQLAWGLGGFGAAAGAVAAAVAVAVSRRALAPMKETASAIAAINEQRLGDRIDPGKLPVELVPVARRLNEMLERLEGAFGRRRQFLADSSHELRTPVAALMTTLEVALRHPRDAEAYRGILERCLADTRHLRRLVERLMEQVRSERLDPETAAKPVDVTQLLDECAAMAESLASQKGVEVRREYPAGLHMRLAEARFRSIVQNLLGNGVEYNRLGGKLTIQCAETAGGLELRVSDTGIGIAEGHLERVFEPFFRADAAHAAGDHLGLGLALVQSHIKAMGGTCRIESELGVGTTFVVNLPAGKEAPRRAQEAA